MAGLIGSMEHPLLGHARPSRGAHELRPRTRDTRRWSSALADCSAEVIMRVEARLRQAPLRHVRLVPAGEPRAAVAALGARFSAVFDSNAASKGVLAPRRG